jgi:hypothetical protein
MVVNNWRILTRILRIDACKCDQRIGSEYFSALRESTLTPLELGV